MMQTAAIEEIDLRAAQAMLTTNVGNRPAKARAIAMYARAMAAGEWVLNGESIKLDEGGRLLDGQNRLFGLVRANEIEPGATLTTWVVRGIPAEAQDSMDGGIPRSLSDQLARRGVKDYSAVSSVARLVVGYEKGTLGPGQSYRMHGIATYLDWVEAHPEASELTSAMWARNSTIIGRPSLAAAVIIISKSCKDEEAISTFIDSLRTGAGLEAGAPALALRNRLINVATEGRRLPSSLQLTTILIAWNATRTGKKMEKFPLRRTNGEAVQVPGRIEP